LWKTLSRRYSIERKQAIKQAFCGLHLAYNYLVFMPYFGPDDAKAWHHIALPSAYLRTVTNPQGFLLYNLSNDIFSFIFLQIKLLVLKYPYVLVFKTRQSAFSYEVGENQRFRLVVVSVRDDDNMNCLASWRVN